MRGLGESLGNEAVTGMPVAFRMPTADELEDLFRKGVPQRIGDGSRRVCFRLPGTGLCVKSYRTDDEMATRLALDGSLKFHSARSAVVREIRRYRFSERGNTSCKEERYYRMLKEALPASVFAVFPSMCACVRIPSRGWCLVEDEVRNADGSPLRKFAHVWRAAAAAERADLEKALRALMDALERHTVRFYDPQNVMVQTLADGSFRLRIVDFEPVSRALLPLDVWFPFLARMKFRRRAERFYGHLKRL